MAVVILACFHLFLFFLFFLFLSFFSVILQSSSKTRPLSSETLSIPMYVWVCPLLGRIWKCISSTMLCASCAPGKKILVGRKHGAADANRRRVYFEIQILSSFPFFLFFISAFSLLFSYFSFLFSIVLIICDSRSIASSDYLLSSLLSEAPLVFLSP